MVQCLSGVIYQFANVFSPGSPSFCKWILKKKTNNDFLFKFTTMVFKVKQSLTKVRLKQWKTTLKMQSVLNKLTTVHKCVMP